MGQVARWGKEAEARVHSKQQIEKQKAKGGSDKWVEKANAKKEGGTEFHILN